MRTDFIRPNYKEISTQIQPPHDHLIAVVKFYWHSVMKHVLKMLEDSNKDLILDFGCGKDQRLKSYLPEHNIISYDVVREFSDVDNYKGLTPYTIVCSHVLEHLEKTENLLARFCNVFSNLPYSINIFSMTVVSKWVLR